MSNSKLAKKMLVSRNYDTGRDGFRIKHITIHHTAGIVDIEDLYRLMNGTSRQVSSHYGIGNDGRIGQYVDEKNTAWTNGNWVSNCTSVTIETSNCKTGGKWLVSDKALNSLIKLVADIGYRNNLGKLVPKHNVQWHSLIVATTCPGDYLRSKMSYICKEANKINEARKKETPKKYYTGTYPKLPLRRYFKKGDKGQQVKYLQMFLNWAVNSKLEVDGIIGDKTIKAVKSFQNKTGLEADGLFGSKSLAKAKTFHK